MGWYWSCCHSHAIQVWELAVVSIHDRYSCWVLPLAALAQSPEGPLDQAVTLGYGVKTAYELCRVVLWSVRWPNTFSFISTHFPVDSFSFTSSSSSHSVAIGSGNRCFSRLPALVAEHVLFLGLRPICSLLRSAVADVFKRQTWCHDSLMGWIFKDLETVCQGDWLVCWID